MTDLLDARGYEIILRASGGSGVTIKYLGASETEHPALTYDEDPYVVSCVKEQEFTESFSAVLKDPGIRTSGLKIRAAAEEDTEISLSVCGQEVCRLTVGKDREAEETVDVAGLCSEEREYLRRIHGILYRLLEEADRICQKHGIRYYLVFGGLLGALRYNDIIPWDDDVDIAMTREDFERFKEAARRELGADFGYLDCSEMGNGAFLDFMCRILYLKEPAATDVFDKVSGKCQKGLENHLPLDIYILDKAFDSPRLHKFHMLLIRGVYGLGMGHRAYLNMEEYAGCGRMQRLAIGTLAAVGKLLPAKWIFWLHDKVSTVNQKKETKDFFMSNGYLPFIHTRYSRAWFEGHETMKLGDLDICVPADVPAYLKRAYYDYYHYPPVEKRIPGHRPRPEGAAV